MVGLRGRKFLILITLDCWNRHFWKKSYIENYFYLLKVLKVLKLLLKSVEELLFERIFLCTHTAQTVSKQVWVRWWLIIICYCQYLVSNDKFLLTTILTILNLKRFSKLLDSRRGNVTLFSTSLPLPTTQKYSDIYFAF